MLKKSYFLGISLFLLFFSAYAQNINEYKYIIVPKKYDFLESQNQYQLNGLTKFLFKKEGFITLFDTDTTPLDLKNNPCLGLSVNLKESGFTVMYIEIFLRNCRGKIVFKSKKGKSKNKDYKSEYHEALRMAFKDVKALHYKYIAKNTAPKSKVVETKPKVAKPKKNAIVVKDKPIKKQEVILKNKSFLSVKLIPNGFQLLNNTMQIKYTALKTSQSNIYLLKGLHGILYKKNEAWYMDFYDKDILKTKKVNLKF